MNDNNDILRTVPKDFATILGMVVQGWKETHPEAIRRMFKWHKANEEFFYKTKEQQIVYMNRKGFKPTDDNKQQTINEQVNLLKSKGMLS